MTVSGCRRPVRIAFNHEKYNDTYLDPLVTDFKKNPVRLSEISTMMVFILVSRTRIRFERMSWPSTFSITTFLFDFCRDPIILSRMRMLVLCVINTTFPWVTFFTVSVTASVKSSLSGPRKNVNGFSSLSVVVGSSTDSSGT